MLTEAHVPTTFEYSKAVDFDPAAFRLYLLCYSCESCQWILINSINCDTILKTFGHLRLLKLKYNRNVTVMIMKILLCFCILISSTSPTTLAAFGDVGVVRFGHDSCFHETEHVNMGVRQQNGIQK